MKKAFSRKNIWDSMPRLGKAVIGSLLAAVPLGYVLGSEFRRWYRFATEADRWNHDRLAEFQLAELRRILSLAYEKTEFYRESFNAVGFEPGDLKGLDDLNRLPTIDKATIRENWQRMLTRKENESCVDLVSTGGTSGEPLRFYIGSSRHSREFAHLCMCWNRMGYRPGDTMGVLRGRSIRRNGQGLHQEYDPLLRNHCYSTFHMSPDEIQRYLEHLHKMRPKFLHAYPSALFSLVKFASSAKIDLPSSVCAAFVESEPVLEHQRSFIEKRMNLRVFSAFGLSEKVVLAAECEGSTDYHVAPTYGYCELLDRRGQPVQKGEFGEIVGTGFINDVMPFIRYRTGDDARLVGHRCTVCERAHMLLADIRPRRNQEFLLSRDGRTLISMTALNLHDDTFDGILRFQFIQECLAYATLNLVPMGGATDYNLDRIRSHFAQKLDGQLELRVAIVSDIPLTRVGKQPMIVQRCRLPEHFTTIDEPSASASSPLQHVRRPTLIGQAE